MRGLVSGSRVGSVLTLIVQLGVGLGLSVAAGCGDSKPKKDAGTDAGGDAAGDGAAAMCKGTFAFANRAQLGQGATAGGKCASATDLDTICNNDIGGSVRTFGAACFAANPGATAQVLGACTIGEIKKDSAPDPSDDCLGCYIAVTGCTLAGCRDECAANPSAPACLQCQVVKGCLPTFYQCSGLPLPPGLSLPDGGTGDATIEAPAGDAGDAAGDAPAGDAADGGVTEVQPDGGAADAADDAGSDAAAG
jgi:hypothetical protein